ncbi:outer membrane protein with beta-barrel domain [Gelidibacter algens]|uniref:Outer membrane protein with beta-barrel domain n=2 Tax=Gelidibacter algens TaxID=49280 RepID=A0A327RQC9_9FLAO|nr:outer membrane beta-barrel protein [Gelidibacter algens]RAJ19220.1 outer membrane protein with beta-barrel domain [Gelidibacter algens]
MKKLKEHLKSQSRSKKLILASFAFMAFTLAANAQNGNGFGIRAGLNYNANGDYFESVGDNAQHPDRNIGFHAGLYGKIGDRFYFKPEVVYTQTKSEYDSNEFKMQKIDAPLLFGVKVLGPVSVFAGPSLQYILDSEFEGITVDNIENDFTVGLNFGIGANFNGFGVDLRYERGLSENEATFVNDSVGLPTSRIDTRPDQLILSVSFAL